MKVRAIRVAEIGRFSQPVAVEGLTGRLDVLAGPNELGKSTLLHALRLALFTKYTSKHAEIVELRPYGGGNPTVEVDFECGDGLWRIRKRFLGQQLAELKSLGTSQTWRGADVDAQISRLLSDAQGTASGDGRFGLLWVGQQDALRSALASSIEPYAGARDAVERALASEVMELTQGERSKRVRVLVQEALSKLQTPTGKARANEQWDLAQRNVDRLRIEVAEAERRLALVRVNLDRLGALREQEAVLSLPSAVHGRRAALETAQAAADAAREAVMHRNLADAAVRAAVGELQRKREALERLVKVRKELAELDARLRADRESLAAAEERKKPMLADLERLTAALQSSRAALDELGLEHAAAIKADRRAAQLARVLELEQRSIAIQRAVDEERALRSELAAIAATPASLTAARNEQAAIDNLKVRLEAAQPALTVAYSVGAKGRLHVDGRPLEDGQVLRPSRHMVIEIDGVGKLLIDPGDAGTLEDISADLDAHQRQLKAILERAGAADLNKLAECVERKQIIAGRISELSATVKALAPSGNERLEAELFDLRATVEDAPGPINHRAIAALEEDIRATRRIVAESEEAVEQRRSEISASQSAFARLSAQCEEAQLKRQRLLFELPPMEEWDRLHSELATEVETLERDANKAHRELSAWAEKVPSAEAQRKLGTDVEAAAAAIRDAERKLYEIGTEAARIDGELASARNEDVESQYATLSAELERAEAHLRGVLDEVEALRLLDKELQVESSLARDQYLIPVLARLRPLVHQVLPNAEVELGSEFAPSGLSRGTKNELLKRLSDGTKEQLAVLTRLALARLFAQSGKGIPVILDDALVYADDSRIEAMFEVLRQASELHQVIVLTCRTFAFDRLGGNRLELRPWQPETRL